MRKNILISIILFLILPFFIFTEELTDSKKVITLDIDTAVSRALENNLSLKSNKIDMDNKLLTLSTVWNKFIPSTNLSASLSRRDSETTKTSTNISGETEYSRETDTTKSLSAGFNTSLSLNATMFFDVYQSVLDYKSGRITLEQAKKELEYTVKKNYYNLVLLKEQLLLAEKEIEYAKSIYEITLLKYDRGMVSEIDLLKSEYSYKSLLPDYKTTQNEYAEGILNFKQIIGLNNSSDVELTDQIPKISKINYDKISKISIDNNLDIQLLREGLKSDKNSLNQYISSLTPSLGLSYSVTSSFSEDFTEYDWFDDPNNWNHSGTLNFSVSIPVDSFFPFSSTQTNIIKATNNVIKSKNDLQNEIEQKQISVTSDILKLKQIEESLEILKLNIDIAERTYNLVEQLYRGGNKSYLDLQDAGNDLFEAKLKLLNAEYEYLIAYLDLKYLLNIKNI